VHFGNGQGFQDHHVESALQNVGGIGGQEESPIDCL
jgi:hypothetical protein